MIQRLTTAVTTAAVQAVDDHPAPKTLTAVGLAVVALGIFLIVRTPAALLDKPHMVFYGAVVAVGLLIVPGVAAGIAGGAKAILAVVGPYLPFGKKDQAP